MHLDGFSPVRKVNNKKSRQVPHSTGSFYSFKMKKEIAYESLSECYFYFFLDLNNAVKEYYPQPIKIKMPHYNGDGDIGYWEHVPDALVFWNIPERKPTLYQIKYEADFDDKKQKIINRSCLYSAKKNNWEYEVIEMKEVNRILIKNIKFLHSHLKERNYFREIIPFINEMVNFENEITIKSISTKLSSTYSELFVIPTIYYLLATGALTTDLLKPITVESRVFKGTFLNQLEANFKGVKPIENHITES